MVVCVSGVGWEGTPISIVTFLLGGWGEKQTHVPTVGAKSQERKINQRNLSTKGPSFPTTGGARRGSSH